MIEKRDWEKWEQEVKPRELVPEVKPRPDVSRESFLQRIIRKIFSR